MIYIINTVTVSVAWTSATVKSVRGSLHLLKEELENERQKI